ncbi:MAG: sigma-70 family RNA polymerase sigma factor [bacterium]
MKKNEKKTKKIDNKMNKIEEENRNSGNGLFYEDLEKLSDEELAILAQKGNEDAIKILIKKYSKFLFSKVIPFYIPGGEREDVIQEAYIGFLKAIKDFNKDKGNFKKFVNICVQRQITTAIKTSNRNKAKVLKNPLSLEHGIYGEEGGEKGLYNYIIPSKIIQGFKDEISIEDAIIDFMEKKRIIDTLYSKLTSKEEKILKLRSQGLSYNEIAKKMNLSVKSVDNAIQRIKKKIKDLVEGE